MQGDERTDVPGYVLTPSAARGVDPDVLAAVEQGTRRRVLLRMLPPLDGDDRDLIAGALAGYDNVQSDDIGAPARLLDEADALVLADPQRPLSDEHVAPRSTGQVVTALVPVATGLAVLHAAGLTHGAVDENAVDVDDDGRPRLVNAGVPAALHALAPREVDPPEVEGDVAALHTLLARLSENIGDENLTRFSEQVGAENASASVVAAGLADLAEPVPLGQADGLLVPLPDEHPAAALGRKHAAARSRPRRAWVLAVVAALGVAGVGAAVWATQDADTAEVAAGRSVAPVPGQPTQAAAAPTDAASATDAGQTPDGDEAQDDATGIATSDPATDAGVALCGAPPPPPEQAPPAAEDWEEVVRALYVRRSAALVTGQTSLLCEVYDPLSPGLGGDLELDAAYREQGVRPDGLDFVVLDAVLVEQDVALVILDVTDELEPYRLVDEDGDTVAELAGIEPETWQARLVPDGSGTAWRFG